MEKQFRARSPHQQHYTRANGTVGVRTVNNEPSMTQQQFKDDCDVNVIMDKFLKTGTITHLRREPGAYLNLLEMPDYQQSLQTVINAQNSFMELDADVRLKFDNDPGKFLEWLGDPSKEQEHVAMGLRVPKQSDPVLNELQELNKAMSSTTGTKPKGAAKKNPESGTEK